jgi:NTP pyrophosphatase (non-canonical NTP hydrolase)
MTEQEVLQKAVEKFGTEAQLRQLQEECAELIVAVNKWFRYTSPSALHKLAEEIVDVQIMLDQTKFMHSEIIWGEILDCMGEVREEKLKRLEEMVK